MMLFDAIVNINSPSLSARREHVGLFECVYLKFVPLMLESQAFLPGWGRAGWTLSCPQASEKLSGTSGQPWKQVIILCALLPTYPNKFRNTLLSVCFNILHNSSKYTAETTFKGSRVCCQRNLDDLRLYSLEVTLASGHQGGGRTL